MVDVRIIALIVSDIDTGLAVSAGHSLGLRGVSWPRPDSKTPNAFQRWAISD